MTEIPRGKQEIVKEAIVGFEKTSEVGEGVSEEDAAEARDVSEGNAKRQKRFLAEIGVLEKDGYDYYLTENGANLGEFIRFDQEDSAKDIMRQLLNGEWEPLDELLANIDSDGMPRQELIDKVAFVTATELSSNRRKYGAETIVDFLEWTEFIESNEDDIYTVIETPNEEDSDESNQNEEQETPSDDIDSSDSEDDKDREEPAKGTNSEKAAPPSEGPDSIDATDIQVTDGVNLNIDLELSGNENPENVRKLILAIRKASDQDIGEYEFPESPD